MRTKIWMASGAVVVVVLGAVLFMGETIINLLQQPIQLTLSNWCSNIAQAA